MTRTLNRTTDTEHEYTKEKLLRISIEFLHDLTIPDDGVMILFLPIKQKREEYFIRFSGREFYLPVEVADLINNINLQLSTISQKEVLALLKTQAMDLLEKYEDKQKSKKNIHFEPQ